MSNIWHFHCSCLVVTGDNSRDCSCGVECSTLLTGGWVRASSAITLFTHHRCSSGNYASIHQSLDLLTAWKVRASIARHRTIMSRPTSNTWHVEYCDCLHLSFVWRFLATDEFRLIGLSLTRCTNIIRIIWQCSHISISMFFDHGQVTFIYGLVKSLFSQVEPDVVHTNILFNYSSFFSLLQKMGMSYPTGEGLSYGHPDLLKKRRFQTVQFDLPWAITLQLKSSSWHWDTYLMTMTSGIYLPVSSSHF